MWQQPKRIGNIEIMNLFLNKPNPSGYFIVKNRIHFFHLVKCNRIPNVNNKMHK